MRGQGCDGGEGDEEGMRRGEKGVGIENKFASEGGRRGCESLVHRQLQLSRHRRCQNTAAASLLKLCSGARHIHNDRIAIAKWISP